MLCIISMQRIVYYMVDALMQIEEFSFTFSFLTMHSFPFWQEVMLDVGPSAPLITGSTEAAPRLHSSTLTLLSLRTVSK